VREKAILRSGDPRSEKGSPVSYSAPRIFDHGTLVELTAQSPIGNDGNDPCRDNPPRGPKQTGPADLIQGNANLQTCVLS
jgi:hypothetical protein